VSMGGSPGYIWCAHHVFDLGRLSLP